MLFLFLIFQIALTYAYDSAHNVNGPVWCVSDADCGNPAFTKCLWQGSFGRSGWGQCRIPWDFGKECNTDNDCYRGQHCHAIYCHGPSTRGRNPILEKGLKKFVHIFFNTKGRVYFSKLCVGIAIVMKVLNTFIDLPETNQELTS